MLMRVTFFIFFVFTLSLVTMGLDWRLQRFPPLSIHSSQWSHGGSQTLNSTSLLLPYASASTQYSPFPASTSLVPRAPLFHYEQLRRLRKAISPSVGATAAGGTGRRRRCWWDLPPRAPHPAPPHPAQPPQDPGLCLHVLPSPSPGVVRPRSGRRRSLPAKQDQCEQPVQAHLLCPVPVGHCQEEGCLPRGHCVADGVRI
jgi:hypothetical protein